MQVKLMHYLTEIHRCGSIYGAAKSLGISQQGLSKAIDSLEAELGVTLIKRSPRGVRFTREGEIVLSHARDIDGCYSALLDDLTSQKTPSVKKEDRVTVHVSYYSAQIASADPRYVGLLSRNLVYVEEPFDKLLRYAELSDGTDLTFADIHAHTLSEITANEKLRFEPLLRTQMGFVWKTGSALENERSLHRETLSRFPVALNTSREVVLLFDRLFEKTPLEDIRLATSSPRLLLSYARTSDDTACAFDSFGFYLAQKYSPAATEDLHFTPLSTPEALDHVGFLMPAEVPLRPKPANVINILRRYLEKNCTDYFQRYPL